MSRVVAPALSAFYAAHHASRGVKLQFNTTVSAFEGEGNVREVVCADGRRFPADIVVVGIGVLPVTDIANAAGIACENGIIVDEHCRTSAHDIYAAGDCTNHPSPRYGRRVRLESVDNAFEHSRSAAANMRAPASTNSRVAHIAGSRCSRAPSTTRSRSVNKNGSAGTTSASTRSRAMRRSLCANG